LFLVFTSFHLILCSFFTRLSLTASCGSRQRFISTLSLFFDAISRQALDRAKGEVPDLESYISLRRDTSGCKPCWALIEYANNLDLPDDVMEHPLVVSLGEAANDLVTWSNVYFVFSRSRPFALFINYLQDIFSYKVEHSKHDTHNMIAVLMHHHSLSLQSAVDFVGDLCKQSIDRFLEDREALKRCSPAWGKKIDAEVGVYVDGLANWIVGSLHWYTRLFVYSVHCTTHVYCLWLKEFRDWEIFREIRHGNQEDPGGRTPPAGSRTSNILTTVHHYRGTHSLNIIFFSPAEMDSITVLLCFAVSPLLYGLDPRTYQFVIHI
jgi:hypothetical protein